MLLRRGIVLARAASTASKRVGTKGAAAAAGSSARGEGTVDQREGSGRESTSGAGGAVGRSRGRGVAASPGALGPLLGGGFAPLEAAFGPLMGLGQQLLRNSPLGAAALAPLGGLGNSLRMLEGLQVPASIRVDVAESDKAYTVKADVPGASKEGMKCEIDEDEGSVTISYERSQDVDQDIPMPQLQPQFEKGEGAQLQDGSGRNKKEAELTEASDSQGSADSRASSDSEPTWHVTERAWGRVSRIVVLPDDAEWNKAEARLENGELTLIVPRVQPNAGEGARPRRRSLDIA